MDMSSGPATVRICVLPLFIISSAHYHRFGSRYDAVVKESQPKAEQLVSLMKFAKQKILDGQGALPKDDGHGALACLSIRFGLDINLSDLHGREVAHTQIERHMRLCLEATTGFERLVTLAGSEPYLAEAAQELMFDSGANPVWHLARNSSLSCVDRGQRGELVAMLIIMHARDTAAFREKRDISVDGFFKALLPIVRYNELQSLGPYEHQAGEDTLFPEVFKDWRMWFNHVIKVNHEDMIRRDHLWKFLTRGAIVMCVDGQAGVDIVIPICNKEKPLSRENVSAILVQVKNNKSYQDNISSVIFHGMEPSFIFKDATTPFPVIRMVFALASDTAKVRFSEGGGPSEFTTYDIWCAGLSAETFRGIGPDLAEYKMLLLRSLQPHDDFEVKDEHDDKLTIGAVKARGRQRRRLAALSDPADAHNFIHLDDQEMEKDQMVIDQMMVD